MKLSISHARLRGRDIREIVRLAEYVGHKEPEHDGGVFGERKSFVKPEDVPLEFLTTLHVVPQKHRLASTVDSKVTYVDDLSWRNRAYGPTNISSGQFIKAEIPLRPRVITFLIGYRF